MPSVLPQVKHIVVLMLENRSMDNVLGWLYADQGNRPRFNIPPSPAGTPPTFDGLEEGSYKQSFAYISQATDHPIIKGTCGNGLAVPSLDPWEEYEHVTTQVFGGATPYPNPTPPSGAKPTMNGFMRDFATSYLAVNGFADTIHDTLSELLGPEGEEVWRALQQLPPDALNISLQTWHQTLQILQTFTPDQLPVLNGLARAFAVSDRWFSSAPTQTNPNRAFLHCGTSLGREKNSNLHADEHFPTDTLWNVLDYYANDSQACTCTWGIFADDEFPPKSGKCYTRYTFPNIEKIAGAADCFHSIDDFKAKARTGTLPDFSFLEPKWGWGVNKDYPGEWGTPYQQGSDYHPPTSVREGEVFVKDIYDALRSNTAFNDTLFIVTFDEHGGTWDHVAPPWGATPPDDNVGEHGFRFDRFGVRIPTLLISPYVEPQTVFRSATNVPYDHTSIIATILKWKGIDPKAPKPGGGATTPWLGHRVAQAPTFENVLSRSQPRDVIPAVADPPPDSSTPLTIKNDTPAQIYVYLGWGPDSRTIESKKLPTAIWGNTTPNGSLNPGELAQYDVAGKLGGELFDYWVQASYYAGPGSKTPDDLVDSVLGINKDWRLFWKGWKLITHHDTLTISLPKPVATIVGPDTKGKITLRNQGLYPMAYDIRYDVLEAWAHSGTLPPGASVSFPTNDWLDHKYYLSLQYWLKGFVPGATETWIDLWSEWKPIGRSATVTITQGPPAFKLAYSS